MVKLFGDDIIKLLKDSRYEHYREEENWQDIDDIGLMGFYARVLGDIKVVSDEEAKEWDTVRTVVWHFVDHDVYIKGDLSSGSYSSGYKLDTYNLKQVFPTEKTILVFE